MLGQVSDAPASNARASNAARTMVRRVTSGGGARSCSASTMCATLVAAVRRPLGSPMVMVTAELPGLQFDSVQTSQSWSMNTSRIATAPTVVLETVTDVVEHMVGTIPYQNKSESVELERRVNACLLRFRLGILRRAHVPREKTATAQASSNPSLGSVLTMVLRHSAVHYGSGLGIRQQQNRESRSPSSSTAPVQVVDSLALAGSSNALATPLP